MKTLSTIKKSQIAEEKRFGKEFQTVYHFFEGENHYDKLNDKFPNRGKKKE